MSDRKEPVLTKPLNQATASQPASQPTSGSVGANAEVDRLAGIKADIIQNWPHLLGSPGPKLIEDCAAMVADEARGEYRALLASRRPKARGFGLALHLARELRDRRNGDATRREQRADAKRDRQRADTAEQIRTLESLRDDPKTPAKDRAEIEAMLNDLHKPKSETGKRARGAA